MTCERASTEAKDSCCIKSGAACCSAEKRSFSQESLSPAAPAMEEKELDCCAGCAPGRDRCDDSCIRTLAAMECRESCGKGNGQDDPEADLCVSDGCCAGATVSTSDVNVKTDRGRRSPVCRDSANKMTLGCCTETQLDVAAKGNGTVVGVDDETEKICGISRKALREDKEQTCLGLEQRSKEEDCSKRNKSCSTAEGAMLPMPGERQNAVDERDWQSTSSASSVSSNGPLIATEACSAHLKKAFDEYTSYLEKGLCICRRVIDRLDSCCGNAAAVTKIATASGSSSPGQPAGRSSAKKGRCHDKDCVRRPKTRVTVVKRGSDANEEARSEKEIRSLASVGPTVQDDKDAGSLPDAKLRAMDVEKTAARQHVLLNVTGMTCTGCSKKMANVLSRMDVLSAVKVTFVSGLAEFDLDAQVVSLQDVLPRIERETGFKCSPVVSDYQTVDLLLDSVAAQRLGDHAPDGVDAVDKLRKGTYRVSYNPVVLGARSLLSSVEGACLAPPGHDDTVEAGSKRLRAMAISFVLATVLTTPVVVLEWSDNSVPRLTRSIVSLVLATFVQAIAIPEFYIGAIKSLVYSRIWEMDMLVVISITAAYGYSVVAFALIHAGYRLEEEEFFETSSLLITLVLLGRLLSAWARVRAVSAVSLRSLQAEKTLLVLEPGDTSEIDARLLEFGDVVTVPPHSRIVTDGEIVHGASSIDESMVTGESIPVSKTVGDAVIAGTINGPSPLSVRLTRLPGKNSITDIATMVENALGAKPRVQDLADKVAGWFIPVVVSISLTCLVIWLVIAVKLRDKNAGGAIGIAITYAIAVLAVSCPCALGLAVPMVLVISGGVAARLGLIIKQADAIERAYQVTDVVFDKTGTITQGDLSVVRQVIIPHPAACSDETWALVMAITQHNEHPVSRTVHANAATRDVAAAPDVDQVESIAGAGIQAVWKGMTVRAGNPFWLGIDERDDIADLDRQGMTLFCLTLDSVPLAAFGLKSTIRAEASSVVASLEECQIRCHLVSGDGPRAVEDVARVVGIPASRIASRHSPREKQRYVERLMASGGGQSKKRVVLFCGDGTNDAVAVAQANVGVQIVSPGGGSLSPLPNAAKDKKETKGSSSHGSPSDVTRATADVVLLGGLDGIPSLLELSRRAFRRIIFNFVWSAVYNVFAILLAAGAFVRVRIPPAYAGLGEIVSVAPVILAAVTLLRRKAR